MAARILIVDDDEATRGGLTELLRGAGYDPRPFGTFAEARNALAEDAPDLLISDLRLDGFNGLQLVALSPRPVPAIIVTGFPDQVLESEARKLGAAYLVKPVAPAALLALVAQRLAGADAQESTRRWTRKPLQRALDVFVGDYAARVLDVSYGGVRFETDADTDTRIPPSVRLVLPSLPLAVDLDVVWSTAREGQNGWLCGAAVADAANPAWRHLVDSIS